VSGLIEEHRLYLRDRHRVSAYERALAEVVRPGSTVVDLASGTGILGMLACRAGAARVYAIEQDAIAGIARQIARANGFDRAIVGIRGKSRFVTLPARADVVVCDQLGPFGVDGGILDISRDARERFLRPAGTLVPGRLELVLAAVEHQRLHDRVRFWRERPAGFDFAPVAELAANSPYRARLRSEHLLSAEVPAISVDLTQDVPLPLRLSAELRAFRDGMLHGLGGWFVASLSPGVTTTNSPLAGDRITRRQMFFPIQSPVPIAAGATVAVSMQILPAEGMYSWDVQVDRGERFQHTTLRGLLLTADDLRRTDPAHHPVLAPVAAARLTVLRLCDGERTLADIERLVSQEHQDLFPSRAQASAFVAGVLAQD
jgi:type I protein arginine methyltransferase